MIEFLKWSAIFILSVGALFMVGYSLGSGKPIKHTVLNTAVGYFAFVAVAISSRYTGVHISLNPWTAVGVGVYGIPAVCFFVLIDLVFSFF